MPTTQATQPAAPPVNGCRPHDWRPPEPTDRSLTCRTCGRVLDFVTQLTTNIYAAILSSVRLRREPAEVAAFETCFHAWHAAAHEQLKSASHADVEAMNKHVGFPSRRERMAERAARRQGGAA